MNNNEALALAAVIIGISFALALGTWASSYTESETAKVALKEGYCSKLYGGYTLWEKCNDRKTKTKTKTNTKTGF